MRTILLLPLTALVAAVAGCGTETRERATGSLPTRDLTLVTQSSELKIASPVETGQLRPQLRSAHPSERVAWPRAARRTSPPEPKLRLAVFTEPAPILAPAEPVERPDSAAATPLDDHELPPGKTVTVIPASSGPSPGSDEAGEPPAEGRTRVAHGGGTCRGRGRGPGITGAPRPDFR
jgi:hypothetical protein